MNSVCLIGRMTKDNELKVIKKSDGTDFEITRFTIAIDDGFGDNKRTNFINCFAIGKLADTISKYCHKGSLVGLNGKIVTKSYDDDKGNRIFTTDVKVDNIHFLEKKENKDTNVVTPKNVDDVWESAKNIPFEPQELPFY